MGGRDLDLHRLFVEVTSRGGINKVSLYDRLDVQNQCDKVWNLHVQSSRAGHEGEEMERSYCSFQFPILSDKCFVYTSKILCLATLPL